MTTIDFNRHRIPPGGWSFRQPETNWSIPTPIAWTFDQAVQYIIKHRKQNPAITAKHNLATSVEAVGTELEKYTRKRLGLPEEQAQVGFRVPSSQNAAAAVAGDWSTKPRQIGTGVATLGDWLGDGANPVGHELSDQRANICCDCPQNKRGDWLSLFTKPVAELIRRQIEERKQLRLATSKDEALGVCDACGCPLKLKVHVPLENITKKLKPQDREKLDARCWILSET